jgi:hypothetical protein
VLPHYFHLPEEYQDPSAILLIALSAGFVCRACCCQVKYKDGVLLSSLICFVCVSFVACRACCCQVKYKDGEEEELWLGIEHVRLMIQPGEQLQPPDAATLRDVALRYAEEAQLLEQQQQRAKQQQKGSSDDAMEVDSSDIEDEVRSPAAAHMCLCRQTQHTQAPGYVRSMQRCACAQL